VAVSGDTKRITGFEEKKTIRSAVTINIYSQRRERKAERDPLM
jgi:hypothetical protein